LRHVLRRRRLKRLIVTLKSGATFDGVLWQHDGEAWVLRNTLAIGNKGETDKVAVDGELILLTADIDYVQQP
jgi:hypothetical protein